MPQKKTHIPLGNNFIYLCDVIFKRVEFNTLFRRMCFGDLKKSHKKNLNCKMHW